MQSLDRAIAVTEQMLDLLGAEVSDSRRHGIAIRALDADRLLARGQARVAFTTRLEQLTSALAAELAAAGEALGLREITVEGLRRCAPVEARRLAEGFARVRALAAALKQLDGINQLLAGRALACVRGYVRAHVGPPAAYDRRGLSTTGATLTTASRRA
jgi:hypothetical protein